MVAYGYPDIDLGGRARPGRRLGAGCSRFCPDWGLFPDPGPVAGRSPTGPRDPQRPRLLGRPDDPRGPRRPGQHRSGHPPRVGRGPETVRRLAAEAGGTCLVVHPGGLSDPADRAARDRPWPGACSTWPSTRARTGVVRSASRTCRPASIPAAGWPTSPRWSPSSDHPRAGAGARHRPRPHHRRHRRAETLAAGHAAGDDPRPRQQRPPGRPPPPRPGTIDWPAWGRALDAIDYRGPIMLECIRALRHDPSRYRPEVLRGLLGTDRSTAANEPAARAEGDFSAPRGASGSPQAADAGSMEICVRASRRVCSRWWITVGSVRPARRGDASATGCVPRPGQQAECGLERASLRASRDRDVARTGPRFPKSDPHFLRK